MMSINLNKINSSLSPAGIASLPRRPIESLYIHVPFCAHKCNYCDFYSLPGQSEEAMHRYVQAILREASWWTDYLKGTGSQFRTIFAGGGTPTVLPAALMQQLIDGIRCLLPVHSDCEWTIEANPATVDEEYCRMLIGAGVNRISIGAQSLIDTELRSLDRIHSAEAVRRTVHSAAAAGFERISIDLMYATPGQTAGSWKQSLDSAMDLGIRHISCYCLTIEEGTPLAGQIVKGRTGTLPEADQLELMQFTRQYLRDHGLPPYEISNYAAGGQECRHNLTYWRCENYLGLGPAAASHIDGYRWRHSPDLHGYLAEVLERSATPLIERELLDRSQRAAELVMMMLRLSDGLSWQRLHEVAPGVKIDAKAIARLVSLGLLSSGERGIWLTDCGVFVADEVIGELVRQAV